MKTLLQITQQFCRVTGLPIPLSVVSSTDSQVLQILGLLNEGLDTLGQKPWPQLETVATFTSTSVENQGALETIAPGFSSMISNTLWSKSKRLIASGSISPQNAQALRIWGTPSALIQFREVNGNLLFIPAGAANLQYSFEYRSKNPVLAADAVTTKQYFTADDDTTRIPDLILIADLRWRWKAEKELAYAENFRTFQILCKQALVDGATKQQLNMSTPSKSPMPGIIVPIGSWK